MYVPKINQEHDQERIFDFIHKNSFAALVSSNNNVPTATHIPIELAFDANNAPILRGHVAKANPHWQLWKQPSQALVIFTGAHSYISSSWYEKTNVSTWNYLAVHVSGEIRIVDEETLYESLKALTNKYEKYQDKPLYFEQLGEDDIRKQMRGIVGFEIRVAHIDAKAKLSQNRNDKDYAHIVEKLKETDDFQAHDVADEMGKRRPLSDIR